MRRPTYDRKVLGPSGTRSDDLQDMKITKVPLDYAGSDEVVIGCDLGSLISITYYRSKRFFSIF